VSVYGHNDKPAPAAATFCQGAKDLAGINEATEARRELSREQSNLRDTPEEK
jgi:hypothetical protein